MRKFITIIGLSAVTTATMAFTAVGPATAAISPPGSVVGQVCASLPNQLTGVLNLVTSAAGIQNAAVADLKTKTDAFTVAQGDVVTALVSYLKLVDKGGSVGASSQVLQDKIGVYGDKAAAWANSWTAKDMADRGAAVAGITSGILNSLNTQACI